MPLKDFKCESCGHEETDKIVKLDAVIVCSECGAEMTPLVGKSNFTLEGGCWYKDGYRK